jgi:hypothetical protein
MRGEKLKYRNVLKRLGCPAPGVVSKAGVFELWEGYEGVGQMGFLIFNSKS